MIRVYGSEVLESYGKAPGMIWVIAADSEEEVDAIRFRLGSPVVDESEGHRRFYSEERPIALVPQLWECLRKTGAMYTEVDWALIDEKFDRIIEPHFDGIQAGNIPDIGEIRRIFGVYYQWLEEE